MATKAMTNPSRDSGRPTSSSGPRSHDGKPPSRAGTRRFGAAAVPVAMLAPRYTMAASESSPIARRTAVAAPRARAGDRSHGQTRTGVSSPADARMPGNLSAPAEPQMKMT
jgi:hypothetical protein